MTRFLYKMILNAIVIVPLLMWFTEATFWASLISGIVLSVIAYILGDQIILRLGNNTGATIADAVLTFVYFWLVAGWMDWSLSIGELIVLTLALGVVEFFYHRYLGKADGYPPESATVR